MTKIFTPLYQKMLVWAKHKYAKIYLGIVSIAESSFFPIPVDIMMVPMVLAKPKDWYKLASLVTVCSVIGGAIGYLIGFYFFDFIEPILYKYGYWDNFIIVQNWFKEWGIWVVLVLGFSPIPYKIATISAGVSGMMMLPFIMVSIVGRASRFFLVAFIAKISANKVSAIESKWIERVGWLTVLLLVFFVGFK